MVTADCACHDGAWLCYRDIGAWLPGTLDCLSGEHDSFCHAHEYLGDQHAVVVADALVGRIATRGGSRRDGDVAMAIFASYVIGQFMPMFY